MSWFASPLLLFTSVLLAQPPQYTVELLPPLAGGVTSFGSGVNINGAVAGFSSSSFNQTAVRYQQGVALSLGIPANASATLGAGINNSGHVVGYAVTPTGNRAFRYVNQILLLTQPAGAYWTEASGINSSGQIVGSTMTNKGHHAVRWTNGTPFIQPVSGNNIKYAQAYAINDSGWMTGCEGPYSSMAQAVLWRNLDTPVQLGLLGGSYSCGAALNGRGKVVGQAKLSNNQTRAFLWVSANPGMINLGTINGSDYSAAWGINSSDQIVGSSGGRAVMWIGAQVYDLNNYIPANSGWILNDARAISDGGHVAGIGFINGQQRGFLLKPIP